MRTIKSATGDVLMRDEDIRERWGQYFSWLMNEENPRVETEEREPNQGLTEPINEAETERALKGTKSGKAVDRDEIPAEVWSLRTSTRLAFVPAALVVPSSLN